MKGNTELPEGEGKGRTMSKVITFGKYSGSEVAHVAITDPSYAAWAAKNLKSADWRNAFAQALKDAKSATAEQIAAAHESPDSPHYAKVLAMVSADKAKEDRQQAEINACLAEYAVKANVNVEKFGGVIRGLVDRMTPPSAIDPAKFSSHTAYQAVVDCMNAVEKLQEKHFLEI